MPGPGGYEEKSTLKSGNITIGVRREDKIENVPGPGEYDQEASKILRTNQGSVRIGTAPRQDIFEEQLKVGSTLPGPGGYEEKSTLKSGNITIGVRREDKIESVPGPGEYDQDASKIIRTNQGSVRIGTAPR